MHGDIVITDVRPQVEGGIYPAKRVLGDLFFVKASIFTHGTENLQARIRYRHKSERRWRYTPMKALPNDKWEGSFELDKLGDYDYGIEAWVDEYRTLLKSTSKWFSSNEDISQDLEIGIGLLREIMARVRGKDRKDIERAVSRIQSAGKEEALIVMKSPRILGIVDRKGKKTSKTSSGKHLTVHVERRRAGFASWYELFPRSQTDSPKRSGTFADVIGRLDDISSMGFNVLYLTPIHPIATTNRRGKDGALKAKPGEPGSPWAIGNENGGHKDINKNLGTMRDFRKLVKEAGKRGMEIALDIALQCSPDHPYVREHPEWFYKRPDGTMRYAENPPKKYYDIYPLNFGTASKKELYDELKSIFLFWAEKGIRIFRVDNPHTKPFSFWEWAIGEVRKVYPDTVFLSEAFTRPKVMYTLSKIGFSQSYTYFTWKNYDWEIKNYFTEISGEEIADHFRPMLFTNTPDILPFILQKGGRPAFMLRAVLAATLSPLWGIYSGYELCENDSIPEKEEYLNSEKYEIRVRDWNAKGNIKHFISKLNRIRNEQRALQEYGNLEFHETNNPNIIFYTRKSAKTGSALMVAININPYETHEAMVKVPTKMLKICSGNHYRVKDLLTDDVYTWEGVYNYVRLIPGARPAHILELVNEDG